MMQRINSLLSSLWSHLESNTLLGRSCPAPIPLFETTEPSRIVPWKLFWVAIVVAFVIANAPTKRISPIIVGLLQAAPETWVTGLFENQDLKTVADLVVMPAVVSLKKFLFFMALLVFGYPIVGALCQSGPFWKRLGLKRLAISAAAIFLILSAITLPYVISPYGLPPRKSGLGGLGYWFGEMSLAPFSFDADVYYGRLLKPALAHYLHLSGYARYHLFSLACTYLLVFFTLTLLESKLPIGRTSDQRPRVLQGFGARWLIYVSVMTCSFIMVSFQEPGKVDDLAYVMILCMATIPMTAQARLGLLTLCVLTHESIALAVVPILIFWLPKEEKVQAVLVIGAFFVIMALSYGFNPSQVLEGHGSVTKGGSVWRIAIGNPGYVLAALFFTYKLWWAVFLCVVWRLWTRSQIVDLQALVVTTCFPLLLCLLAWDTTRIAGIGFLGMLVAVVLFMKEAASTSTMQRRLLLFAATFSLIIPSYQIILDPPAGNGPPIYMETHSTYPYLGVYRLIHSAIHSWLT